MEVVNFVAQIIASIIDVILLEGFMYHYFGSKRKHVIAGRSVASILLFLPSYFLSNYPLFQATVLVFILFCYARIMLKGKWNSQLLVCIIEDFVTILISLLVILLMMIIFHFTKDQIIFQFGTQRFISICINRLVYIFIYYIVLNIFCRQYKLKPKEWILSLIYFFSATSISILLLVWTTLINISFYEQIIACAISLLLIITTVVSLFLIVYLSKKNEIDMQNQVLRSQVHMEKSAVHNLEREYSRVKILRHDMNKQLNIYLQLLKDGKVDLTIENLLKQIENNNTMDMVHIQGNNLISAVLSEKLEMCKKENILFRYEVSAVIDAAMEMDIAIMIANLLDNAIEAEVKQKLKSIHIEIFELKSMINIIVKNYIESSVLEENPDLQTNKDNMELHGYGMKSIKATTEKFNGMIQCFEQHNEFIVHVILGHTK